MARSCTRFRNPSQGFPNIPGVTYTGWYNPVDVLDKSVLPNMPIPGKSYTILVPKTDSDGNSISGIRTPDVQVPIATYTGWALRRAPFAANEDCALTGQYIPFPSDECRNGSRPAIRDRRSRSATSPWAPTNTSTRSRSSR